jgi:hypothetical protein
MHPALVAQVITTGLQALTRNAVLAGDRSVNGRMHGGRGSVGRGLATTLLSRRARQAQESGQITALISAWAGPGGEKHHSRP